MKCAIYLKTFGLVGLVGLLAHGANETSGKVSGPVKCWMSAHRKTSLSDEQAARLCHCQRSDKHVDCYLDAHRNTFLSDEEILTLCSGSGSILNDLDCVE